MLRCIQHRIDRVEVRLLRDEEAAGAPVAPDTTDTSATSEEG
jgi:hypothetical protein